MGGKPSATNWVIPLSQWGGDDINGGVNPQNVQCVTDATLGKTVLQFTAHGDQFNGTEPVGITHDGTPRAPNAQWKGWNWGYDPKCTPHCNTRRVGGAVQSVRTFSTCWCPRGMCCCCRGPITTFGAFVGACVQLVASCRST